MGNATADVMRTWQGLLPEVALACAAPSPPAASERLDDHTTAFARADLDAFLTEASARKAPLTLVVNDGHRFTDTPAFLEAFFAHLGRRAPALRLLVAAGSHRSTPTERRAHGSRIVGPWRARFGEIRWHDASDVEALRPVGAYAFHPWMTEGGAYLACGSMEPHYFAGVTGAHKTLTVGVMALASLEANHVGALSNDAAPLRLDGNPVHDGIASALAALEASGARLFALNQIVIAGTVRGCTAGPPLQALADGVGAVRRCFTHPVPTPLDVIVARVEPPLDRDLYQADKGIKNTEGALRNGGVLLLEAACGHGVGLDRFVELLRAAPTAAAARAEVRTRGYRLGDHKAVRLRTLTDERRVAVGLVSTGVDPGLAEVLGVRVFADRGAAAAWARAMLPVAARGLLVEDAGNLVVERARA